MKFISIFIILGIIITSLSLIGCDNHSKKTTSINLQKNKSEKQQIKSLPKLIDFGAKKCIACKKMEPILDDLKKNYSAKFTTKFIDVWQEKNQTTAIKHKIKSIPTQIFFAADGKELFRHSGFYSKKEMLEKWTELGVK